MGDGQWMDFCFSAGVMGWHEFIGLKEMNWISGSSLGFAKKCSRLLLSRLIKCEA